MNRREFFSRTAGIVAATTCAMAVPPSPPSSPRRPLVNEGTYAIDRDGNRYRYVRAERSLNIGDLAFYRDAEVCYAASPLRKGEYGWAASYFV